MKKVLLIGGLILVSSFLLVYFLRPHPYKNCTDAAAHGVYNIKKGSPLYKPKLDRNHNGVACEK